MLSKRLNIIINTEIAIYFSKKWEGGEREVNVEVTLVMEN